MPRSYSDTENSRSSSRDRRERTKSKKKHSHRDSSRDRDRRHPDYDPYRKIKEEPQSDVEQRHRHRHRDESEADSRERERHNRRRVEDRKRKAEEMQEPDLSKVKQEKPEKKKPTLEKSGKLTEDTNTYNGVVIKYNEPQEARKPKRRWRLYIFKGDQMLPVLYVHRQSAYLLGRDRRVADIPIDHPSCSKQHAVFQYRMVTYERPDGTVGRRVRPYIIDLESANGTYVNNVQIDSKRYVELLEKDVLKFGYSSREYVLLHENSKEDEDEDDDV